ncbi:MAG TPA: hypothetical protein VMT15_00470 [Bryobacteraceae bacterium]|nr:hypothetical protein [Bryobacteraceae bacterium]
MAGAYAPDSGFSPEGDQGPWGPLSTFVVYTVNIAIYSVAAYAILWGVGAVRWRTASKTPSS